MKNETRTESSNPPAIDIPKLKRDLRRLDEIERVEQWQHEPNYGGVIGADGNVYSDADPGL